MSDADYMGTQFDRFDGFKNMRTVWRLSARYHTERPDATERLRGAGADRTTLSTHGRGPRPQIGRRPRNLSRSDISSQVPAYRLRGRNKALHHVAEFFHFLGF